MKESYLNYHYDELKPETDWLFVVPSPNSQDLQCQIQEVGHMIWGGRHFTSRGPLESYQISISGVNTSGSMKFRDRDYHFPGKGEVLFLDCTRGYDMESEGTGNSFFVHFWSRAVAYYYELFMELNNGSPILIGDPNLVQMNINKLLEIYKRPVTRMTDIYAEELIMEMIMDILKQATPKEKKAYSKYVQASLDVIQAEYAQNLSLDVLANKVYVSKYYLSHIFKKEVGLTPASYLQQYRLTKAKELLSSTNLSQESICDKVGLYNCSYLSKLFRTYEGITPDQYRKKWGK